MEKDNKSVLHGIIVVVFFLFGSKILSFFTEMLTAYSLGATKESDIYYVVYGIYSIISPMVSVGIWKVFMPAYKERIVLDKKDDAADITDKLIVVFSGISFVIIGAINLFPSSIIMLFAPGFSADTISRGIPLLRIISLLFWIGIIHTFFSAILQANERFEKSQSKGIFQHIPTLCYLILFRQSANILGLTLSIVIGEMLAAFVMVYFSKSLYRFKLPKRIFDKEIYKIIKIIPSACAISIINQVHSIIDKAFASSLAIGSITCLNYGSKLCNFFDGIFSTAVSTAVFPTLTELIVKGNKKEVNNFINKYISILSLMIVVTTTYIVSFSNEIVYVLFGRGNFSNTAVILTSNVLLTYALGLLAMCLNTILNDVFYIVKQTKPLLMTTIINVGLNIVLDFCFVKWFDVVGLSLATTVSLYITMAIKLFAVKEYVSIQRNTFCNVTVLLFGGLVCYMLLQFLNSEIIILRLLLGGALTVLFFSVFIFLFSRFYRKEIMKFVSYVKGRVSSGHRK